MEHTILFPNDRKETWLGLIAESRSLPIASNDNVIIDCSNINNVEKIEPLHVVSLACFIEEVIKKRARPYLAGRYTTVGAYIFGTLRFAEYFSGVTRKNHIHLGDRFLLWRIQESEKEAYSRSIHDYLRSHYFQNKDLSAVKNSIDEALYNIFDHAEANGNAFSFIEYNEKKGRLRVAVCDFGVGIAKRIRGAYPEIPHDALAIEHALGFGVTTKSQVHNQGMGLGNIRATCTEDDYLRIFSNKGMIIAQRDTLRHFLAEGFCFDGTLIYYDLSLKHFEDEEIFGTFELF